MNDPAVKAKWVSETRSIVGIPAESLGEIAKQENIKYVMDDFPDDPWLEGMLLFKGTKRAIVVNTHIGQTGRHNFTFAHELGHHFLEHPPTFYRNGESGIRCSSADVDNSQKPREVQANRFAAELLMPEVQFRLDMSGADIDFGLINNLANHYMVSKHACSNRILSLTSIPCIVIRSNGQNVIGYCESKAARGFLRTLRCLPDDTAAQRSVAKSRSPISFSNCESEKWLVRNIPGATVQECTHVHVDSGSAMTIIRW